MAAKLRWGIIATGGIAGSFAAALPKSKHGKLEAVASRSQAKADAFGAQHGAARCYGSYEALLADKEVDAVYIATPHPQHPEWSIKAAQAGKHILCEKPMALNFKDAQAIIEAARQHKVFFMEALMYRCHPQTAKLVELLQKNAIGEVRGIQATFSYRADTEEGWVFDRAAGGGAILDMGTYCTSIARLVAGLARGGKVAEPVEFSGNGLIGKSSQVDEIVMATAVFPGGIVAQLSTANKLTQDPSLRVYGTTGSLVIAQPYVPAKEGGSTSIQLYKEWETEPYETHAVETADWLYAIEADTVAQAVAQGLQEAPFPAMGWEDSLGNMKMLDQWRKAVGMRYPQEGA